MIFDLKKIVQLTYVFELVTAFNTRYVDTLNG